MHCDNYGKSLPDHSSFCPLCGSQQGRATNPPPSHSASSPAPFHPFSQQMQGGAGYSAPPGRQAPLSTWQYLAMLLLMFIPLLNIILILVWSFGDVNLNRKNLSRAMLLLMIASIVVTVGVVLATGGLAAVLSRMQYTQ